MDFNNRSPVTENADTKAEFRKPSVEALSRKYRRRTLVNLSTSSDGSPKRDCSSSPNLLREDAAKDSERRPRRKDDGSELDRDSSRSQYGRNDSYRQSSRSSHGYSRHDEFVRHRKHTDEEERDHRRLSSLSGKESRCGVHSDHSSQEDEHGRSKDFFCEVDKYSRDKYGSLGHRSRDKDSSSERAVSGRRHAQYDERERDVHVRDRSAQDDRGDYHRSSGEKKKKDWISSYEESRGSRNGSASGRDDARIRLKEAYESDPKELDGSKPDKEERRKYNDREKKWDKDQYGKELRGQFDDTDVSAKENQESPAKKPKLSSFDKEVNHEKDVSKLSNVAEEKQSSSFKHAQDDKMIQGQGQSSDIAAASDLSAAKVAAMKAAELVNKNIVGVGFMTTDQKKKLLWGNKKSAVAEESGNRWDTTLFTGRERQEKFNKLMGVKGDMKMEHNPNNQDGSDLLRAEKQKELQIDLEKQYTAGLRRRDGRTVGLGL